MDNDELTSPPPPSFDPPPVVEPPPTLDTVASLDLRGEEPPPGTWLDLLLIVVASVFAMLAGGVLVAIYSLAIRRISLETLKTDARLVVAFQIVIYALTLGVMYLVTRSHRRPFWRAVRWTWPRAGASLGFLLAGAPLAIVITLLQNVLPVPKEVPFEKLLNSLPAVYSIGVLAIVVAPFMEELFFRGYLYPLLKRHGDIAAVVITSAAFALMHGSQYGWAWTILLLMFLVGLALTGTRSLTGSLVPCVLLHVGYNATLFSFMYFATDHFRHLEKMTR